MRISVLISALVCLIVLFIISCKESPTQIIAPTADIMSDESAALGASGRGIVADRYIITLKKNIADPAAIASLLGKRHGLNIDRVYKKAIKGFAANIPAGVLKRLQQESDVVRIEPDIIMHAVAQTLPTGINRINAEYNTIADIDATDDSPVNVDIVILDTGIDPDHPDLNVVGGTHFYVNCFGNRCYLFQSTNFDDDNGHGTHVAGTAAARDNSIGVVGVAPGARLWAVKVLDASGSGYLSAIIAGLDWVAERAADIEVANMSIGGQGFVQAYQDAIAACVNAGVVVVVAAGNENMDVYGPDGVFGNSDDVIPAAYPEAMTISALADADGRLGGFGAATAYGPDDSRASFSNFSTNAVAGNPVQSSGAAIDLMFPGVSIYSTYMNGQYATMSGTSMACPHATGLVALHIAATGRATDAPGVYAIRQALIDAGKEQTSVQGLAVQNDPDQNKELLAWAGPNQPFPPIAAAGSDKSAFTTDAVSFDAAASDDPDGLIQSYTWDFGDGQTATGKQVTHAYAVAGTYTVTLTVVDDEGLSATDEAIATIAQKPIQVFYDGFDVSEWNSLWTEDAQNDWYRSTQRKKDGKYSAEVDGSARNASITSIDINLQGLTNATISFYWLIESGLDAGEYLAFDVSTDGGATWVQKSILKGNVNPENSWQLANIALTGISMLKLRFRGKMSGSDEDADVDMVKVVAN